MLAKPLGIVGPALLVIGLLGSQSSDASAQQASVRTSEDQHVMGSIEVESAPPGRTRIGFWINTRTWKAKKLVLESAAFKIGRDTAGAMLVESGDRVTLTGLSIARGIEGDLVLASPEREPLASSPSEVMWDRGFRLRIQPNGELEWACCPR